MTLKGYIDFSQSRERAKQQLLARIGNPNHVPPYGWDSYLGTDADLHKEAVCQQCGETVIEVRPFGPNWLQICEECAKKDLASYEKHRREVDGA